MRKSPAVVGSVAATLVLLAAVAARGGLSNFSAAIAGSSPSCGGLSSTNLATHLNSEVDSRLAGLIGPEGTISLFSTRGAGAGSTWVRNPNVWTSGGDPVDWTGLSPWNSAGSYVFAGTLISPRHVAMANHYAVPDEATVVFVTADNQIVERTLTAQANVWGTDIQIGILDSAVPESIAHYAITPATTPLLEKLLPVAGQPLPDVPIVTFDQEDKALVRRFTSITSSPYERLNHALYSEAPRGAFSEILVSGDSGNPGFLVVDGTPVLALTHHWDSYGPHYGSYVAEIDAAMDSLSGSDEYDPVVYDFSCFDTVGINNAPEWDASINVTYEVLEAEGAGDPFHTLLATDADGDTVSYSLTEILSYTSGYQESGTFAAADYFTVDPATGVISPVPGAVFDYETLDAFTYLGVKATDDGGPTVASSTQYIEVAIIDQEDSPEFGAESYSFSVAVDASAGASVGAVSATDEDAGEVVSYSIVSGNDAGGFSIDGASGAITVAGSLSSLAGQTATLVVQATSTTAAGKRASDVPNYATMSVSIGVGAAPTPVAEESSRRRRGGGGGGGSSSKKTATAPATSATTGAKVSSASGASVTSAASAFVAVATHEMTVGSTGEAVRQLQKFLNASGFTIAATGVGSPGQESTYFGNLTRIALAKWQAANGISPAAGYLGPKTYAAIAAKGGQTASAR